jgi:threonine dehydratase
MPLTTLPTSTSTTTATASHRAVARPDRSEVAAAHRRIAAHVRRTPLVESAELGALLKLETLQPTGSFKVRGAFAALTRLAAGTPVVTASAGNHGLGVAHAAAALGLDATVVVPETASPAKLAALGRYPARLVRHGATYDEAEQHALALEGRYVSPYNDPDVIAGQGTIALELAETLERPCTIVCPLGGGGLASGLGLWASGVPGMRVVAVESEGTAAMRAALDAGRIVPISLRPTIADGLGGNIESGSVTFELVRDHVDDVVVVREEEIEAAIRHLAERHGLVVEGAGAVAVAALLAGKVDARGGRPVALVTGRNIAAETLARLLRAA